MSSDNAELNFVFNLNLNLGSSYGAYLIATLLSNMYEAIPPFLLFCIIPSGLLGVTCLQVYLYFRKYNDTILIRGMVVALLALELVHGGLSMHATYQKLIINFANPLALLRDVGSLNATILIKILIIVLVQVSYAMRIYHVSERKFLVPTMLMILSLTALGLGCVLTADLFRSPLISTVIGTPETLAGALFIIGAMSNFLVVGTMGHYLNKSRTGIKQTEKMIDRLIIHIIHNGLLTGIIEMSAIILLFINRHNLYFLALSQVIGNLYANCWMATLNSRNAYKTRLVQSSFGASCGHRSVASLPTLRAATPSDTITISSSRS